MQVLAPQLHQWLERYNRNLRILEERGFILTPEASRDGLATMTRELVTDIPTLPEVYNGEVKGDGLRVPVRLYHPQPGKALPVLIYFHGGGHMAGSVEVYDPICRKLALAADHLVVSTEYRLAPEHPYPAGIDDAKTVVKNIFALFDALEIVCTSTLSIGGDSAGGAMAATLAHAFQHDPDRHIAHQVLIYPSLDYTLCQRSIDQFATGYLLHKDKIRWCFDNYLQHEEDREEVSPLLMECDGNLPATMVITAGFCPLRDEGIAYVNRLKAAGVRTRHLHMEDMIHAYLNMESVTTEACKKTYEAIGSFLLQPAR